MKYLSISITILLVTLVANVGAKKLKKPMEIKEKVPEANYVLYVPGSSFRNVQLESTPNDGRTYNSDDKADCHQYWNNDSLRSNKDLGAGQSCVLVFVPQLPVGTTVKYVTLYFVNDSDATQWTLNSVIKGSVVIRSSTLLDGVAGYSFGGNSMANRDYAVLKDSSASSSVTIPINHTIENLGASNGQFLKISLIFYGADMEAKPTKHVHLKSASIGYD